LIRNSEIWANKRRATRERVGAMSGGGSARERTAINERHARTETRDALCFIEQMTRR